jgi:HEAT repeat protein
MDAASSTVTSALIQTLNNDSNVNVRLAALEALKPYAQNSNIREQLVRSIPKQESPLVQVSLAELMAALQEKSSVKELQKILHDDNTPVDVKKKIQETINVMI